MPFLIFFFSRQIFCFPLLTNTNQGHGRHWPVLIYVLISPPIYLLKLASPPRFPKYMCVCVVNLVSLIHTLPRSNLSSSRTSSPCRRLRRDSFLTLPHIKHSLPLRLAAEVGRTGKIRVKICVVFFLQIDTVTLSHTPYSVCKTFGSCRGPHDMSWRRAGGLSKAFWLNQAAGRSCSIECYKGI